MAKKDTEQQATPQMDPVAEAEKILEEARAKAAAIVANAEAEAAQIVEAAKKTAETGTMTTKPSGSAPAVKPGEELVPVYLFKDNERYKDDKFVAVNGKTWQIKRGETVMVPKYVADVLAQSMAQDTATANMIERKSSEYEAKAKALNI